MRKLAISGSLLSLVLLLGCAEPGATPPAAPDAGGPTEATPADNGDTAIDTTEPTTPAEPTESEADTAEPKADQPAETPE